MVAKLTDLSNTQLAVVWNAVTGQAVRKFTNKETGLKRVRKQLQADGIDEGLALNLAGLGPKAKQVEGVDGDHDHPCRPKDVEPAQPEPRREKVEGVDYEVTTDQWGYKHRKPTDGSKQEPKRGRGRNRALPKSSERTKAKRMGSAAEQSEARQATTGRGGKMQIVLGLLSNGATVPAIMEATGWLPHTTRAYLSKGGALRKAGIMVVSERVTGEDGKKVTYYRVGA